MSSDLTTPCEIVYSPDLPPPCSREEVTGDKLERGKYYAEKDYQTSGRGSNYTNKYCGKYLGTSDDGTYYRFQFEVFGSSIKLIPVTLSPIFLQVPEWKMTDDSRVNYSGYYGGGTRRSRRHKKSARSRKMKKTKKTKKTKKSKRLC